MDRNQVTGLVLIVLIVLGFVYYQSYVEEQYVPAQTEQSLGGEEEKVNQSDNALSSAQAGTQSGLSALQDTVTSQNQMDSLKKAIILEQTRAQFGSFASAINGQDDTIVLENKVLRLYVSSRGGHIAKAVLKDFRTYADYKQGVDGELTLFEGDSSYYQIDFEHQGRFLNTRDFYFEPSKSGIKLDQDTEQGTLSMRLRADNGGYIEYLYTLKGSDYMVDFQVNIVELDREIGGASRAAQFNWEQVAPKQEKSLELERQNATIFYYSDEDGRDWLGERSTSDVEVPEYPLKWISMKQQYFSSALVAKENPVVGAKLTLAYAEEDSNYVKRFGVSFPLEVTSNVSKSYQLFLGPNDYDILSSYDVDLEDELNLGVSVFKWVNQFFIYPIFQLLLGMGLNVGIAIILLTFAIKLVLFPITYKNFLSSAKMRVIKPHLEKLNEENKNADPMKKQQATMELYKKTGVNPLAGCIPALLQMPILIALYKLFPTALELRHQPFLWADDLSSFDSILSLPFSIPFYGDHVSLFTLLMAISMFFYMRYNQQMTPTPSASGGGEMQEAIQKNMKLMMNLMPIFMLFMFNGFAAGLSFYYFLANVITIAQTLIIKNYIINEDRILEKINEHMKKPMQKSKWQRKLEEIQKNQKR